MRKLLILSVLLVTIAKVDAQDESIIVIETNRGDIELLLYNETPLHKENMLQLIDQDFYIDQLFHRVIKNFMIQGGDPHSQDAPQGQRLGTGGPGYTIPAEIIEGKFHKKGVIAAARLGDRENPEKRSSGSQFYIVKGQVFTIEQLDSFVESGRHKPFTSEQITAYTSLGGTPHLDGSYTVFGEVIKGIEIVDEISLMETNSYDRPIEDIVYSISIKELSN